MAKAILVLNEMPENCLNCQLAIDKHEPYAPNYCVYCTALEKQIGESWVDLSPNDFRPDKCPLREMPEELERDKLADRLIDLMGQLDHVSNKLDELISGISYPEKED